MTDKEFKTSLYALMIEANREQNKSLENFLYYTGRKRMLYDYLVKVRSYHLHDLLNDFSMPMREQILFEMQAQLLQRAKTLPCPHDWVSFKKDSKKGCAICFKTEDLVGK